MSASGVREVVRVREVDAQAVCARLVRDGVAYTYVLPPKVEGVAAAAVVLPQVQTFLEAMRDVAEAQLKAEPKSDRYAFELGCYASAARLVGACLSSATIKSELRRLAAERAVAERAAVEAEAVGEAASE